MNLSPLRRARPLSPLLALLVAWGWPGTAGAAPSAPVTTAAEFWGIPTAERNRPHEARLELTAMFYDPAWRVLWGIDRTGSEAYFPIETASPRIRSGQHFLLSGSFVPARGLDLAGAAVTLLPDLPLPAPLSTRGDFANSDRFNGRLVTVDAYVNSQSEIGPTHLLLELAVEGYPATARVLIGDDGPIPQVNGAFVRLVGVYVFDTPAASFRPNIWVAGPADVRITGWLDRDSRFRAPAMAIEDLSAAPAASPVHIVGEVVSQKPGVNVVVRDATGQATLLTAMTRPLQQGEPIEAVGFPSSDGMTPLLRACLYRPAGATTAPAATRGLSLLRLTDQVRRLSLEEAARGYPVRLNGVVTWSHPGTRTFYLLDPSGGIAVRLPAGVGESPGIGSRLNVAGRSIPGSFAPAVQSETLEFIETLPLPVARPIALEQALSGLEEDQWVSLRGYARAIRHDAEWDRLTVDTPAGDLVAVVPHDPRVESLQGAVLNLSGVSHALTDDRHQLAGVELWVPDAGRIDVVQPRPANLFDLPLLTIASLRQFHTLDTFDHRVRLAGVVVDDEPGVALHLQEGDQSLLVLSRETAALAPGDRVEVVGFPGRQGRRLLLREAHYRRVGRTGEPAAASVDRPATLHPELDGRLVRLEALVTAVSPQPDGLRLLCQSGDTAFVAVWDQSASPPRQQLSPGCQVALTGVYLLQLDESSQPRSFTLRLRDARDISVLQAAPWWTGRRIAMVVGVLLAASIFGFAWIHALRRRVRHQTDQIREQYARTSRLEAELLRSSRLDSLGVLAGGIAHDFNNLLSVILGNFSLVLGDRDLSPEHDQSLRQGERAAFRARDLTQQLLTFAKGGEPVRETHPLPELIREAAGFALHGAPIRADFDLAPAAWPAHADRGQISQVIHNIVLNARHAMKTGGRIQVVLRNETVAADAGLPLTPGRYLRLEIHDEGGGISPENLPRIFDPYFTTKQHGSGLGLATAYSIVKKHGGHIAVDSRPGKGTTFRIWLPAAAELGDRNLHRPTTLPHLTGRVLIMDDEADVRTMTTAMLKRLGLDVTITTNGAELVETYRTAYAGNRPFSLVIADLTVPGAMGGREAAAELRRLDPNVRVIVSSGYSNDPVMANFRDYGFVARMPKPYEFGQFAGTIAAVLEGNDLMLSS